MSLLLASTRLHPSTRLVACCTGRFGVEGGLQLALAFEGGLELWEIEDGEVQLVERIAVAERLVHVAALPGRDGAACRPVLLLITANRACTVVEFERRTEGQLPTHFTLSDALMPGGVFSAVAHRPQQGYALLVSFASDAPLQIIRWFPNQEGRARLLVHTVQGHLSDAYGPRCKAHSIAVYPAQAAPNFEHLVLTYATADGTLDLKLVQVSCLPAWSSPGQLFSADKQLLEDLAPPLLLDPLAPCPLLPFGAVLAFSEKCVYVIACHSHRGFGDVPTRLEWPGSGVKQGQLLASTPLGDASWLLSTSGTPSLLVLTLRGDDISQGLQLGSEGVLTGAGVVLADHMCTLPSWQLPGSSASSSTVFLGSSLGDSALLKFEPPMFSILPNLARPATLLPLVSNPAPVTCATTFEVNGETQVLLCCGVAPAGTLRIASLTFPLQRTLHTPSVLQGRPSMFACKASPSSRHHALLVVSHEYPPRTEVLSVGGTHFQPVSWPGLKADQTSLLLTPLVEAGEEESAQMLQVTPQGVNCFFTSHQSQGFQAGKQGDSRCLWQAPSPVSFASGSSTGLIALGSSTSVHVLTPSTGCCTMGQQCLTSQHQVSALAFLDELVSDTAEAVLAIGRWVANTVSLRLCQRSPQRGTLITEPVVIVEVAGDQQARSILAATLGGQRHLFVGCSGGDVAFWHVKGRGHNLSLHLLRRVFVGLTGVDLFWVGPPTVRPPGDPGGQPPEAGDRGFVYAHSNRGLALVGGADGDCVKAVRISGDDGIASVASLHTAEMPRSLAWLDVKGSLTFGQIAQDLALTTRSYALADSPSHVAFHADSNSAVLLSEDARGCSGICLVPLAAFQKAQGEDDRGLDLSVSYLVDPKLTACALCVVRLPCSSARQDAQREGMSASRGVLGGLSGRAGARVAGSQSDEFVVLATTSAEAAESLGISHPLRDTLAVAAGDSPAAHLSVYSVARVSAPTSQEQRLSLVHHGNLPLESICYCLTAVESPVFLISEGTEEAAGAASEAAEQLLRSSPTFPRGSKVLAAGCHTGVFLLRVYIDNSAALASNSALNLLSRIATEQLPYPVPYAPWFGQAPGASHPLRRREAQLRQPAPDVSPAWLMERGDMEKGQAGEHALRYLAERGMLDLPGGVERSKVGESDRMDAVMLEPEGQGVASPGGKVQGQRGQWWYRTYAEVLGPALPRGMSCVTSLAAAGSQTLIAGEFLGSVSVFTLTSDLARPLRLTAYDPKRVYAQALCTLSPHLLLVAAAPHGVLLLDLRLALNEEDGDPEAAGLAIESRMVAHLELAWTLGSPRGMPNLRGDPSETPEPPVRLLRAIAAADHAPDVVHLTAGTLGVSMSSPEMTAGGSKEAKENLSRPHWATYITAGGEMGLLQVVECDRSEGQALLELQAVLQGGRQVKEGRDISEHLGRRDVAPDPRAPGKWDGLSPRHCLEGQLLRGWREGREETRGEEAMHLSAEKLSTCRAALASLV